jgi:hypothetical protein
MRQRGIEAMSVRSVRGLRGRTTWAHSAAAVFFLRWRSCGEEAGQEATLAADRARMQDVEGLRRDSRPAIG